MAALAPAYVPRRPTETVLYALVRENLECFLCYARENYEAGLPRYVEARVYNALLQGAASELASRRRACKSATDNAEELIKTYTRLANAARQADITQEISEIVGGADALASAGSEQR